MERKTLILILLLIIPMILIVLISVYIDIYNQNHRSGVRGVEIAIENEIDKLFEENDSARIIVFPPAKQITIEDRDELVEGFAFSIKNIGDDVDKFSYSISAEETTCELSLSEAEDLIVLGRENNLIWIQGKNTMDSPITVRVDIPETTPSCRITYELNVKKNQEDYSNELISLVIAE